MRWVGKGLEDCIELYAANAAAGVKAL